MTISLYLDKRRPKKDGTCPVAVSVNRGGDTRYVTTGVSVDPRHWDAAKSSVKTTLPSHKALNTALRADKARAEIAAAALPPEATAAEACRAVRAALKPDARTPKPAPAESNEVADMAARYASLKCPSTALTYQRTEKHLRGFAPSLSFDEVTRSWLMAFDAHMASLGLSPNTRAIHMRNLRAVVNFAIDEGATSVYGFRRFRIKTVGTEKRNLPVADLRRLLTMDVEDWQKPYRDFFALSFYLIGANAKDLLFLPKGAVKRGRLSYNRAKTKRLYSLKVEPEAAAIISGMAGSSHLINVMDGREDYLQFVRQCNHALSTIGTTRAPGGKRTGDALFPGLTTYWARHSWATVASSLDIPKDTIAAALGHGENTVTDIYIDYDREKVDQANRRVIDWVLYGKK